MIEKYSFGRMVIDGTLYSSDLTIINGTVHPDWWRKNGHRVCVEDVAGILADTPQILVIGRGRPGLMKSEKELRARLKKLGVELIEQPTASALQTFNRLTAERKHIGAGFHLTC